jgi:hypothetical protein
VHRSWLQLVLDAKIRTVPVMPVGVFAGNGQPLVAMQEQVQVPPLGSACMVDKEVAAGTKCLIVPLPARTGWKGLCGRRDGLVCMVVRVEGQ